MKIEEIILANFHHTRPFLFVDNITYLDDESIMGEYTFKEDEFFYKGHFEGHPVTPGVILIECMAQIALVCHSAFFLLKDDPEIKKKYTQFFSAANTTFYKPVYPGEKVIVSAKKSYFRHGKIKSNAKMLNTSNELICKAELSGMVFIDK